MTFTFKFQDQLYKIELEEEDGQIQAEIDGESIPVEFQKIDRNLYSILLDGRSMLVGVLKKGKYLQVFLDGDLLELESISEREQRKVSHLASGVQEIKAPMPSRVVKLFKKEGEDVEADEALAVIEAMKMESELKSPIDGKVTDVMASEGDAVEGGTVIMIVSSE